MRDPGSTLSPETQSTERSHISNVVLRYFNEIEFYEAKAAVVVIVGNVGSGIGAPKVGAARVTSQK